MPDQFEFCAPPEPTPAPEPKAGASVTIDGGVTVGDIDFSEVITAIEGIALDPQPQVLDLRCACMFDDTTSDQTALVKFVRVTKVVCETDGTVTVDAVGDFVDCDMTSPYAPVGPVLTAAEAQAVGSEVVASDAHRRTVTGTATGWTVPYTYYVESLTVVAISGDIGVTDSDGVTSTLHQGEANSWGSETQIVHDLPSFDLPAGAVLSVVWTEPHTI